MPIHRTIATALTLLAVLVAPVATHGQSGLVLDPSKAVTQYPMDVWGADEGLPQKSIYAILQSRDGYLWLGTQEGLVRFDGIEFHVFDKTNSELPRNAVSGLHEAADGSIWVGTREGGLTRFEGNKSTTYYRSHGLSSENVSGIAGDGAGNLWIGTDDAGLNLYSKGKFYSYTLEDGVPSKHINALLVDRRGKLWIGTRGAGVASFDGEKFVYYDGSKGLPGDNVAALFEDREGSIWVGTRDGGLARIDEDQIRVYDDEEGIPASAVSAVSQDGSGSIWVGVEHGGLYRLRDGATQALTAATGLPSDNIRSLLEDREGSLWIGTDGGGLVRIHNGKFAPYGKREGLADDYSYGVFEDSAGNIWVGSEGGGVSRIADGRVVNLSSADGLPSDVVYAVEETPDGSIWLGTEGGGLVRLKGGQVTTLTTANGLPTNTVYSLFVDADGALWVATSSGGLSRYENGRLTTFNSEDGLSSNFVTTFTDSERGGLWVGTYDGGLNYLKDGRVVSQYTTSSGLKSDFVLALYEDSDGILWVGTREGGLHRVRDGRVVAITTKDGLFNDIVNTIVEDNNGSLWMTCNKGLFRVSRSELNAFADGRRDRVTTEYFDRTDGLRSDEFNGGFQPAGWKGKDGRLWFPSDKGIVAVNPERIAVNQLPPLVHVESITADGRLIEVSESTMAEIKPGTHKFEFRYVGLSFIAAEKVRYQYSLDGVDEGWVDAGRRRIAFYTNLSPGEYTFRVRASNSDGVWSEEEAAATFYLKPFFYQTTWFLALCILMAFAAPFMVYRMRVRHLKQRQLELEELIEVRTRDLREEKERTETALQQTEEARREAEEQKEIAERAKAVIEAQAGKLREMDKIKSRFFGNISHEFRTPLTLTIGPLENALTGMYGPVSPALSRQLEIMLRNSRRLLRLINQLLDLSKLESGSLTLKVIEGSIVQMLEGVVMSFTAFAEKEGIELSLDAGSGETKLFFDPENLEKVFFNLLSNAVKFTPEDGRITVSITETTEIIKGAEFEVVEIRVSDTGQGIPSAELPHIFDRFHQVDGTVSRVQEGTGIGLSLVKELVELHGGTIRVESEIGMGTEFIVILPKGTQHLRNFEIMDDDEAADLFEISRGPMMEMAVFEDVETREAASDVIEESGERKSILVVDDSADIRNYVVGCLDMIYSIEVAKDGVDGLEKLEEVLPDLIISDVMMPRMDGYEFCRNVKADPRFNHIPVILLTSKASLEAKIEGLQAGSDDYLSKPFNAEELRVRVANLVSMREQAAQLKGLNHELEQANQTLREASELKSQLLSIASHDMKNPLTAIREFSRILKEEMDDTSHLNELVDLIFSSSDEMLRLVTQLLDSSALESGKLELNRRPVDLGALGQLVVHKSAKQAELKGQQIHFSQAGEGKSIVMADFDRLQEAMDNLINNAIKYSAKDRDIWVSVVNDGNKVRFEVKDEGPGIKDEELPRVFDKFQKLSNQPTGGESSTGLGLSIVKQIVDMHEGMVWVESEHGTGSTFVIELLAADKTEPATDRPAMPPSRRQPGEGDSVPT